MFFVKLLHIKVVRNGSFSPQRMVQGSFGSYADTSQGYVLYVLRAGWTPDAAQL